MYLASLSVDGDVTESSVDMLSTGERERADRFHYPLDRVRYIAAHAALREILGAYAGISPGTLEFRFSKYGKPALAETHAGRRVEFNMSHSGELALIALSTVGPLGVDVEYIREERATEDLALACLSSREIALLGEMPVDDRVESLYRWWTRKEALAKALGEGLVHPLDSLEVVPPLLAGMGSGNSDARLWRVWDISPRPGYAATLVANGPGRSVSLMAFKSQGLTA